MRFIFFTRRALSWLRRTRPMPVYVCSLGHESPIFAYELDRGPYCAICWLDFMDKTVPKVTQK